LKGPDERDGRSNPKQAGCATQEKSRVARGRGGGKVPKRRAPGGEITTRERGTNRVGNLNEGGEG